MRYASVHSLIKTGNGENQDRCTVGNIPALRTLSLPTVPLPIALVTFSCGLDINID